MEIKDKVGRRIAELRSERGWTQFQLAERAGIGTGYVAKIEQGVRAPSLKTYAQIAEALGVELWRLFVIDAEDFEDPKQAKEYRELKAWLKRSGISPKHAMDLLSEFEKLRLRGKT